MTFVFGISISISIGHVRGIVSSFTTGHSGGRVGHYSQFRPTQICFTVALGKNHCIFSVNQLLHLSGWLHVADVWNCEWIWYILKLTSLWCQENNFLPSYFFPEDGVGLVPKRGYLLTLAYYAFPRWYEFGERRWNYILTGENRRTRRKICPSANLSTTNPTWIDPGANPGLRGARPATNDLSHGTVLRSYYKVIEIILQD
jgi:hypothetical protein